MVVTTLGSRGNTAPVRVEAVVPILLPFLWEYDVRRFSGLLFTYELQWLHDLRYACHNA